VSCGKIEDGSRDYIQGPILVLGDPHYNTSVRPKRELVALFTLLIRFNNAHAIDISADLMVVLLNELFC